MVLTLPILAGETNLVTLHLRNGDRLTGEVISEDADRIVLSTPWNAAIYVPRSTIQDQVALKSGQAGSPSESTGAPTGSDLLATEAAASATVAHDESKSPGKPDPVQIKKPDATTTQVKPPSRWKWNLRLGADYLSGAKNRQIYSGGTSLTYTRTYKSDAKKFLRNKIEYSLQYGETEGNVSANAMAGANKLDFDIFGDFYGYGLAGVGYDKVRKIEFQYEWGPGLGYHLIAEKTVALDVELGLNYQYREGLAGAPNREAFQARVAEEVTWEVLPKITLTESVAFLPFLDAVGEYQVRISGNVGFGIVRYLSLNLTVLNLYDTQPAPGVPNNDFQLRSSLGVTF